MGFAIAYTLTQSSDWTEAEKSQIKDLIRSFMKVKNQNFSEITFRGPVCTFGRIATSGDSDTELFDFLIQWTQKSAFDPTDRYHLNIKHYGQTVKDFILDQGVIAIEIGKKYIIYKRVDVA